VKNRLIRVRELLQRELGAIIARDHAFPNVLVTVNDVDITPDLKHAYVYIGVIGPQPKAEHVVEVLNNQHGDLQTRVSKRVVLKNTPRFHFRLDHSVERGVRITSIMETIDQQLAAAAARDAAAGVVAVAPAVADEDEEIIRNADIKEADDPLDEDDDKAPKAPVRHQGPRRSPRHFPSRGEEE
jgi:ribosome-binding factor A